MTAALHSLFSLEGKTVLVTGGGRGLGEMMATSLVEAGAKVYISSRSAEACHAVAERLQAFGQCIALPADLSQTSDIEAVAASLHKLEPKLDVLINNAGRTWGAPLTEFPERAWDDVMNLNVKSIFLLVQKLLPLLQQASSHDDPARIINIGSVAGIDSDSISAYSYGASKAAVHQLTRMLARDLVRKQINVNAIAPGLFPSKMTSHLTTNGEVLKQVLKSVPMRRMGKAEEIGGLAVYLASPASAFMTGNIIPLDGGHLVGEPNF